MSLQYNNDLIAVTGYTVPNEIMIVITHNLKWCDRGLFQGTLRKGKPTNVTISHDKHSP